MQRTVVLGLLLVVGTLSSVIAAQRGSGAAPAPMVVTSEKLNDNLFVLRGGGGNTAAFITANGVILVDTKMPGWGKPLIEAVQKLTDKPITTIINTHSHYDHVSGNVEFPANIEIVTSAITAKLMRVMNPVTGSPSPSQPDVFKDSGGRGLPTRTFTDRLTLGSGNERIELYHFGPAHTGGDTYVLFPFHRVLHAGDTFPNKGLPIADTNNGGSVVAFPDTLTKAATIPNVDTVITGHSALMTPADMQEYIDFTRTFREDVRAAKKAGKSVDEVASTWTIPERFKGYAAPQPGRLKAAVQSGFDELK